ncbi:MAG: phosphate ABC transporter permease subunit PstC [Alphaproteobacteria bacterium]|nr:phosphate ABC transporter permease subunit PstC [Alphaproteobacteria bacterium]
MYIVSHTGLMIPMLAILGYGLGWYRASRFAASGGPRTHSLPPYHGLYVSAWAALPAFVLWMAFLKLDTVVPDEIAGLVILLTGCAGLLVALRQLDIGFPARYRVERLGHGIILFCALVSILITVAILLSVLFEAIRFFNLIPMHEFLFGTHWSPQMALRADQAGSSGSFGAVPLFAGTLLITLVAMLVAIPVGLLSAIYMSEYATRRVRDVAKPVLEILAGIPTVVYGYFAVMTVAPFFRGFGEAVGLEIASESALVAGLVMGVMIIPFVSSLSDDVINAVPQSLRDASYGMGATASETIKQVVIPAALPGIMGAVLLAISRAVGETMIVVMAAGLTANLTLNPLESVTTVTAQIVSLLVGDQEFDSPKTLAAFALGITLFVLTLSLNVIALRIVRRYRERYE